MSSPWLIQVPVAKSSPKILSKLRLPWFSVLFFPFLLTSISSSFQPINYNCLYHLAIHSCFFNSAPLSSVSVQGELRKEVGTLTLLKSTLQRLPSGPSEARRAWYPERQQCALLSKKTKLPFPKRKETARAFWGSQARIIKRGS